MAEVRKEGYLHLKTKKWSGHVWKYYWFILSQGSLFYYKHPTDSTLKGSIHISGGTIKEEGGDGKKDPIHILTVKSQDGEIALNCSDEEELKEWKDALESAIKLPKLELPPARQKKQTDSATFRAKKNLAGKAATSSLGKKYLRNALPQDLKELLDSLLKVVTKKSGAEKSKEVQNTLIKLLLKANFQLEKKTLTPEDLTPVYKPLRDSMEFLAHANQKRSEMSDDEKNKLFASVEKNFKTIEQLIQKLFQPYIKSENSLKIKNLFAFLGAATFLHETWDDESVRTEVNELSKLMEDFSKWEDRYENFTPMRASLRGLLLEVVEEQQLSDAALMAKLSK